MRFRLHPLLPAFTASLLLVTSGNVLADDGPLPVGQDVSLSLPAGGSVSYAFPDLTGATLTLRLSSGDVDVSAANLDQSSASHSSLSGTGTSVIAFQSTSAGVALQLASTNGAQLVVNVAPGSSGGGTAVVSSGGSVSSITTSGNSGSVSSVTTSGSSGSGNRQVSVSGGGSSIVISNGQVTITSGP